MSKSIEFKVGDKVYYPSFSNKVLVIKSNVSSSFPLRISAGYSSESFTKEGHVDSHTESTSIVLATQENKELLDRLYGVEFEAPPPKTVTVHFEMPVTFVPELNEVYWYITVATDEGVEWRTNTGKLADRMCIKRGVWRSKEEALLVVNSIFNPMKENTDE